VVEVAGADVGFGVIAGCGLPACLGPRDKIKTQIGTYRRSGIASSVGTLQPLLGWDRVHYVQRVTRDSGTGYATEACEIKQTNFLGRVLLNMCL
jgi:hypothetical protein